MPLLMQRVQQLAPDLLTAAVPADFGYVSIMRADNLVALQRAVQSGLGIFHLRKQ